MNRIEKFIYNYFINPFYSLVSGITGEKTSIFRGIFLLSIFLGLNFFLIVATWKDWQIVGKAGEYELPSILYGLNEKNEYEPIAEFYQFSRVFLKLEDFKEQKITHDKTNKVLQCFISTEDNNFYTHFGLDFRGILRAMAVNLAAGKVKEGASTITQQVTRLKFLSIDRTFIRKAREAWLALILELRFPKNQILEMYMNEIPLGHGTIGVGAAARFYFRKNINSLSWGEAALLSSLTTRPKEFSPIVNPQLSASKVRIVFMKLVENGKLTVEEAVDEYNKFYDYYLTLNRSPNDSAYSDRLNRFPYFTEYVRRGLKKTLSPEELYGGGLKIYSTLNIVHQREAEKALSEGLKNQTKISNQRKFRNIDAFDDKFGRIYDIMTYIYDLPDFKYKISRDERSFRRAYQEEIREAFSLLNHTVGIDSVGLIIDDNYTKQDTQDHLLQVEGGIVSMRPETGYVTALVGGTGFRSDNQQIRPIQGFRQPGSSFKPLLYSSAMDYYGNNPQKENNITAASLFLDSPLQYVLEDGDEWSPENYSEEYAGFMRLRAALESSKNSVAVRVIEQVGLANVLPKLTELLQLSTREIQKKEIPKNYSVALGTFEVTPFELTRAYASFVSGGKEVHPISVLYITDEKGNLVKDFRIEHEKKERKQILSPEVCFIITSMMQDVIRKGTGKAVLSSGLRHPVAGKTGTTNNFRDAWFVGYTPGLVSSVWLGYDIGTISLGRGMSGGVVATPIWGKFMAGALKSEPIREFHFKDLNISKLRVCSVSGKLPGPQCRNTYDEYFIKGTEEKEICHDHRGFDMNIEMPLEDAKNPSKESKQNEKDKKQKSKDKRKPKAKNIFHGDEKID